MSIHDSSVNFQNLIRDLAEMYPYDVGEVVLVEIIANSLDAKASHIDISFDNKNKTLVITDDGSGMNAKQFDEYHDFATGLKKRGTGIGFAGVGAKISFNIANRVITETKSANFSGASNWFLSTKNSLKWKDTPIVSLKKVGTRIEISFKKGTVLPFSTSEDVIKLLKVHYLPLFDTDFLNLYSKINIYSSNLRFLVNGKEISPSKAKAIFNLDKTKEFFPERKGKRVGYGLFGVSSSEYPISPGICGVLLCTYGKVIKTDLFNQFPGSLGPKLFGLVEVPEFVDFLTTTKTDFIKGKGKYREFESYYDPIRQHFKSWLSELGIDSYEVTDNDDAVKLERELRKIADQVPELAEFFGFRFKSQIPVPNDSGLLTANVEQGVQETFSSTDGPAGNGHGVLGPGNEPGETLGENKDDGVVKANPISRTAKRGPKISFVLAPDRSDISWVDGNNIAINTGVSSYIKVHANSSARKIYNIFAIANAILKFLGNENDEPDLTFIDRMISAWSKK